MALTTKQTSSTFNFETYNDLMKGANSGLKLWLAEQMLTEVLSVMARYRSPLLEDITQIVDGIEELRDNNKKYQSYKANSFSRTFERNHNWTGWNIRLL